MFSACLIYFDLEAGNCKGHNQGSNFFIFRFNLLKINQTYLLQKGSDVPLEVVEGRLWASLTIAKSLPIVSLELDDDVLEVTNFKAINKPPCWTNVGSFKSV